MLKLSISARSHSGNVRPQNEDMILADGRFLRNESYEITHTLDFASGKILFAVADGMGGHNAGEIASEEALSSLSSFFKELPSGLSNDELTVSFNQWIQQIHTQLNERGMNNPTQQGMGTTLVGFFLYEGQCHWFNCGDSRIYHMHNGNLKRLSIDHSYEQMTGIKGKFPHAIINCIGANASNVFLDISPINHIAEFKEENTFVLCSDGFTDLINDNTLARFLSAGITAPTLVRLALDAGGHDNISVCVVKIQST